MGYDPENLIDATDPVIDFVLQNAHVKTNLCSRQITRTGYTLMRRSVFDYNLIFITQGNVVWQVEETRHLLTPGQMVLVRPGVMHSGHSTTRRMTLGSLHFEMTLAGGQDAMDMLILPSQMRFDDDPILNDYLRLFLKEFDRHSPQAVKQAMNGWGELISRELIRKAGREKSLKQRSLDQVVVMLLDEINQRVYTPTSLEDLAGLSGFSAQHLNRMFNRSLAVTPLQYLVRLRMDIAGHLLRETPLSVASIAQKLTYQDPYYFSRLFKQHHGRSPSQYREGDEQTHIPGPEGFESDGQGGPY